MQSEMVAPLERGEERIRSNLGVTARSLQEKVGIIRVKDELDQAADLDEFSKREGLLPKDSKYNSIGTKHWT